MIINKKNADEYTLIDMAQVASVQTDNLKIEFYFKGVNRCEDFLYNNREELERDISLIIAGIEDGVAYLNLNSPWGSQPS